jgi:uncharacterized protein (TIGR01777 family)
VQVLISGASGLVGRELSAFLERRGDSVLKLVRTKNESDKKNIYWDPEAGLLDGAGLENLDAVVHLAGENISEGRWTDEKKARIRNSRVKGTTLLSNRISSLKSKPRVLVSASAIGIYGNRGSEVLTENSSPGDDFLSGVCRDWESSTVAAKEAGIRVVNARIGIVLSKAGGALGKLLVPFKMGVGGRVGSGKQYMSWIAITDLISAIAFAIENDFLNGPVNLVSPNPVTNEAFTNVLGDVLSRPTILPAPAFALRMLFGEMADALLLSGARVMPEKLISSGYRFQYPELKSALKSVLGK